jgi:hypothetical protein
MHLSSLVLKAIPYDFSNDFVYANFNIKLVKLNET